MNYEKEFDTVWRNGLFYKRDKSGIFRTNKVYKIVAKMYEGVKSHVFTGWMDERCFRPLLCTVKAELGRGQPGLMR